MSIFIDIAKKKTKRFYNSLKKLLKKKEIRIDNNKKIDLIQVHRDISRDMLMLNSVDFKIKTTKAINKSNIIYFNKHKAMNYVRMCLRLNQDSYHILVTIKGFRTGGTDKLLICYLNSICKIFPDVKILLLVIEGEKSPWADRLHSNIELLYWSTFSQNGFDQSLYESVLSRFLVQFDVKVLWNFNCRETFLYIERKGDFLSKSIKIWGLIFAHWLEPNTLQEFGMAHENLPYVIKYYDLIISDNERFIDYICSQYGWSSDKFETFYIPNSDVSLDFDQDVIYSPELKVIWASGIEWNKGVDILPKIAKIISHLPIKIEVYGGVKNAAGENLLINFNKNIAFLKNISYKGGFDDFKKVVNSGKYECFLFTSLVEGMPNVVIEAAECKLKIISPAVGGLPEFLDKDNSYVVADQSSPEEYLKCFEQLLKDKFDDNKTKINNLIESYNSKFTHESFSKKFMSKKHF